MAREPQRRDEPRHLDAAIVPVRDALIARAKAIEAQVEVLAEDESDAARMLDAHALATVAQEWRALADELHHW